MWIKHRKWGLCLLHDIKVIVYETEIVGCFEKLGLENFLPKWLSPLHTGALAGMARRLGLARAIGCTAYTRPLQRGGVFGVAGLLTLWSALPQHKVWAAWHFWPRVKSHILSMTILCLLRHKIDCVLTQSICVKTNRFVLSNKTNLLLKAVATPGSGG